MKQTTSTKERILEAAAQVFAKKGYHNTRMDDIVDAANTSKGGVYFHFSGKERLFLAVVDQFAALLENRLAEAIADEESGMRSVEAALRAGLSTFGQYRTLAKIFLVQAVGLGQSFEEKRLQIHQRFARLIQTHLEQAVQDGDISPLDTEIAAHAWVGAINEVVIRWILTGQPEPDRILPALFEMLLRSIGAQPNNKQPHA